MANKRRKLSKEAPILQLKLTGPGVRRGRVSVPDLVKICEEAQNIVNKQAEALKGKKTTHPGPIAAEIRQECTLELIAIEPGSTELQFDLAKSQMRFHFKPEWGAEVVSEVAATIRSLASGKSANRTEIDPGVLLGVYELGGVVETGRISKVQWIAPSRNGFKRLSAPITKLVRERVAARLSRPRKLIVEVEGILDMADFGPQGKKCRIDRPIGPPILCEFDPRRENEIYALLRRPVRVKGEGTLQPYTDKVSVVFIEEITPLHSLDLGEGNFFAQPSMSELAVAQQVGPLTDPSILTGGIAADEDLDAFLEEIYQARR